MNVKAIFMMAALSVASWMQATTISWKEASLVTEGNFSGYYEVTNITVKKTGAMKASFNFTPTTGTLVGCLMSFGGMKKNIWGGINLYYDANGKLAAEMRLNADNGGPFRAYTALVENPTMREGRNEIVIVNDRTSNASAIFINGVKCFEVVGNSTGGYDDKYVGLGRPLPTDGVCNTTLSGAELSDIRVEESGLGINIADVEAYYKSLPEPTALALLALGVAGVALRRRAA